MFCVLSGDERQRTGLVVSSIDCVTNTKIAPEEAKLI